MTIEELKNTTSAEIQALNNELQEQKKLFVKVFDIINQLIDNNQKLVEEFVKLSDSIKK